MKDHLGRPGRITTLPLLGLLVAALATVQAQEGPFSNASMNGTYMFSVVLADAEAPVWNRAAAGMGYYDGAGNVHLVFFVINFPGEPDADGNPTRNAVRHLSDEATWEHVTQTYEVLPFGGWVYQADPPSDALPMRTEMIDGVPTITEFELYNRGPAGTGGVGVWHGRRIADGDILPPAPE